MSEIVHKQHHRIRKEKEECSWSLEKGAFLVARRCSVNNSKGKKKIREKSGSECTVIKLKELCR